MSQPESILTLRLCCADLLDSAQLCGANLDVGPAYTAAPVQRGSLDTLGRAIGGFETRFSGEGARARWLKFPVEIDYFEQRALFVCFPVQPCSRSGECLAGVATNAVGHSLQTWPVGGCNTQKVTQGNYA